MDGVDLEVVFVGILVAVVGIYTDVVSDIISSDVVFSIPAVVVCFAVVSVVFSSHCTLFGQSQYPTFSLNRRPDGHCLKY